MKVFNSIKIAKKLPMIIAVLCIAVSATVGTIGYLLSVNTILAESRESLRVLTEQRRADLEYWSNSITEDVIGYATNPTVIEAMRGFDVSFALLSENPTLDRQQAYITDNPFELGEKDRLDRAPESVPYNFQHAVFHPFLRQLKDANGYYDIFLFNTKGDLIYSVYKENDYATNFVDGPFADSGLGQAFSQAVDGEPNSIHRIDFAPYAPSYGAAASFMATPIFDETGKLLGVFAIQVPANRITEIVTNSLGLGETGEMYAVGPDYLTRTGSRFEGGYGILSDAHASPQVIKALAGESDFFPRIDGINGQEVVAKATEVTVLGQTWGLVGELHLEEVMKPVVDLRNVVAAVIVLGGALAVLLGWLTGKMVTTPLARLGENMQAVSDQKFDSVITDTDRKDEIGALANTLVAFRDKLQKADEAEHARQILQVEQEKVVESLSVGLTKLATGDLTTTIDTTFPSDYEKLRADYNRTIENLNQTVGAVVTRTGQIRQGLGDMSTASDDLLRRTETQAATLEETAAALDEMTASVKSAASGAREVEEIVFAAQTDADESGPVVHNAVTAMTEIEKSSEEISQIIGVIDDIAFQTNLLALNAGVEAARAGEAGRGFAVVASEVRALAQRSSDAAGQIKELIGGSSEQVQRGVKLVGKTGEVLTKIVDRITHISELTSEISRGAQEQSSGLGEINIGVTQLDQVTQQNAMMVDQATASSHKLNQEALTLADMVSRFQLGENAVDDHAQPTVEPAPLVLPVHARARPEEYNKNDGDTPTQATRRPEPPVLAATGTHGDAAWEDF